MDIWRWRVGPLGWGPGRNIPQTQMFEYFLNDFRIFYERSLHLQVIKSGDSIAQDVVVSGSAILTLLPDYSFFKEKLILGLNDQLFCTIIAK